MIKNLSLNIFGLMILTLLLNYCTPYSSSSSPIRLGPDISNSDPDEPDPDDGSIYGMLDVNTIRNDIYNDLTGNTYTNVGVYKSAGGSDGSLGFSKKVNGGSGYAKVTFNNAVERNNRGMFMSFRVNTAELKDELLIPNNALFTFYVADSNGVIDTRLPSDKTLSNDQITNKENDLTTLLGINIFKEEYGFSGKEINLILAYSGTNGKKYYIKYPFQFEYKD